MLTTPPDARHIRGIAIGNDLKFLDSLCETVERTPLVELSTASHHPR